MTADLAIPAGTTTATAASRQILEAARYLGQCRLKGHSFAVLTGPEKADVGVAIDRFLAELPADCRVARMPAPTDSHHAFLEAVLAQLGFEPFDSTADDLQRLLTVVLRQGAGREATTLIVVEDAQDFGPRVLETIRELARNARDTVPAPLFVLAGHAGLHRVLDSRGMASVAALTAARFDLGGTAGSPETPPRVAGEPSRATLELSLNRDVLARYVLDRDRLLIGRSQYADIAIASRFVSRQHALLVRNPDGDWLIDLNSTNGTAVNSQLIEHYRLDDGDIVSIGNFRLRYQNPDDRPQAITTEPTRDQASETMVMRSLRGLHERAFEPDDSGSASTAA